MELHESLAQLARDHGESLFTEADAFRGALDDYLDEGSASTGTINLLTDAVRLGALQGMITMLDSGASVEDAVESAGQRSPVTAAAPTSPDRSGRARCSATRWARCLSASRPELRPDAHTAEPPSSASGSTAARPSVSPGHAPSPADRDRVAAAAVAHPALAGTAARPPRRSTRRHLPPRQQRTPSPAGSTARPRRRTAIPAPVTGRSAAEEVVRPA